MKKMTARTLKQLRQDLQEKIDLAKEYNGKYGSCSIRSIAYNQWVRQIHALDDALKYLPQP